MPDPREIARLKKTLRNLADEDAILAARGEAYVDLPPPPEPEPLPPDLQAGGSATPSRLLPEELFRPGALPSTDEAPSSEAEAEVPELDFSSLLQDLDLSSPGEEPGLDGDTGLSDAGLDDEAEAGTAQGMEDAGLPDFSLDEDPSLSDIFSQGLPESPSPAETEPADDGSGFGDLGDLGSFADPGDSSPALDETAASDPFADILSASPEEDSEPPSDSSVPDFDLGSFAAPFEDAIDAQETEPQNSEALAGDGGLEGDSDAASADAATADVDPMKDFSFPSDISSFDDDTASAVQAEEAPASLESPPQEGPSGIEEPLFSELPEGMDPDSLGADFFPDAGSESGSSISPEAETPAPEELYAEEGLGQASSKSGGSASSKKPVAAKEDISGFDAAFADFNLDAPLDGPGNDAPPSAESSSPSSAVVPPTAEEDPFAAFNFGDMDTPASGGSDGFDSELAALDMPPEAHDTFAIDSAWGEGPAESSLGSFGSQAEYAEHGKGSGAGGGEEELPVDLSLSEKELDLLQDSLLAYPLNLRLEIEQALANDALSPSQSAQIIQAMVDGRNAAEAAALIGRFLNKRIRVPKGFEQRTGEAFEAQKGSFWYAFKKNILPLLALVGGILVSIGLLTFLGYQFIWKPLYADSLYRSGHERIGEGDYLQSERLFSQAVKVNRVRAWYFRYAEAYIRSKQYSLAEAKYEDILRIYGKDKRAAMDYARFESEVMLAYEKAESILKRTILNWKPNDPDGLLLLGDIYYTWSEESRDEDLRLDLLERMRKTFAHLIRVYGRKDVYMGRMLLYFMRMDKMKEVTPLKDYFLSQKKPRVDSFIYAELGGYLIDKAMLEEVRDILFLGVKKDPLLPENHYQLSRYYRATNNPEEERKALSRALRGYEALPSMTRKRLAAYIDTLNWSGDWSYKAREYLDAEKSYQKAINAYEDALSKRRLSASARFGEVYANLADIYYYDRSDFENAFALYQNAERNLYTTADTAYKRGYVRYRGADYKEALAFFYQASADFTLSDNLLLSTANTLYYREDYSAAAGFYMQLIDLMRDEIDRIQYADPQNRPDQSRFVRTLLTSTNNLGVSLYHLASRLGDASYRAQAMVNFTESMRLYDIMNRDMETMLRPLGANLSYLNLDGILHPNRAFVPQVYPLISKDLVDSDEKMALDAKLYSGK